MYSWSGRLPLLSILRAFLRVLRAVLGLAALGALGLAVWLYREYQRPPGGGAEYVAMGSSFASGPGAGPRVPGSPVPCGRTEVNYAHLLARARDLDLTDVTCAGSNTASILTGGRFTPPAQLDALRPSTKLVTVTIGGNDVYFMANLLGWSCQGNRDAVPALWRLACRVKRPEAVERAFGELEGHLTEIADEVHRHSPAARLVFVDYFTVLPETGACPGLPMTAEQVDASRSVARRLNELTRRVAKQTHADLISASALSITRESSSPVSNARPTFPLHSMASAASC